MSWRNNTTRTNLSIHRIDLDDATYLVPSYEDLRLLSESVRRIGVVNSPVVQGRSGMPAIPVLGRRRLQVATLLGFNSVEVLAVQEEVSTRELYAAAFWDNVERARLSPATRAYVVGRLMQLFPVEETARNFLPALGVNPTGPRLERLRSIGGLDARALEDLGRGAIDERAAWLLADLEFAERGAILDLAEALRLNSNKTRELVSALVDLSVFRETNIKELLHDPSIEAVLGDPEMATPEKAGRIRKIIREWRFPEIVGREHEFEKQLASLIQDSKITVSPTPGFEDERCVIRVSCDSWDDAEEALRNLSAIRPKSD